MRGVPGGGGMSENSVESELRGVCLGESVTRMLVFSDKRPTNDCGVMSEAYAVNRYQLLIPGTRCETCSVLTFRLRCE